MITCDTNALIYWALAPARLTPAAAATIETGRAARRLACADIVLWEIAMLAAKGRITLPIPPEEFLRDLVTALALQVLPITPFIAALAQSPLFPQRDPADRLIGATALQFQAPLVTADLDLATVAGLNVIW